MRIGIVCPYTWDVPGGVQVHIQDLAEALMADGHHVSVISPAAEGAELPPYVTSAGRAVPVPFNGSVARMSFGFLSANRVRRWVREGRFDVLHVHEPAIPSLGLLACWVARGPIVATFHASYGNSRSFSVGVPVIMSALEKIGGRIAVSDAARKTLVEFMGGDAVLIPNGVTVSRYTEGEPLPGWDEGEVIGFLGRMDEPRKGLPVLLEAFALLAAERPALRLLLAGPGDADEVLERVPPAFHDRIGLLGMVSEEDKVRAYHTVDVFCAPNLGGESFGIVLTEAMSAGAAVLASDIPAFRKVLDDGRAGALFETGDARSLAREAAALLDDPGRRAELSEKARLAVRKYDWSTVARDVLRVYETVASTAGVEEDSLADPVTDPAADPAADSVADSAASTVPDAAGAVVGSVRDGEGAAVRGDRP
ncbi:glycosyltransferase family 4 protein [Streptosporangium sp. H16]|uniref:glycosyltransferase family 4 protein n=1 Tax=Streptosporangium sp. H16 TaxID=3444184 RepID=UPI003F7B2F82